MTPTLTMTCCNPVADRASATRLQRRGDPGSSRRFFTPGLITILGQRHCASTRRRTGPVRAVAAALVLLAGAATAEPFAPASDAFVLAELPAAELRERARIAELHAGLARDPSGLAERIELGQIYLALHRQSGDPRYLGYAAVILAAAPTDSPHTELQLQRAELAQAQHDFADAARLLDEVLAREPRHARAWLMRAAVAEVSGDYARARSACAQLLLLGQAAPGEVCAASIASLSGRSQAAYEVVTRVLDQNPGLEPATRSWAHSIAGEIAQRLDDPVAAERHLRAASELAAGLHPPVALADFLLDAGRPEAALEALANLPASDPVLLRRAIAESRLGLARAARSAEIVAQRVAAVQRIDDRHARERALHALRLSHDTQDALDAARANWALQKERIDARLLLEAALAARAPDAAAPVIAWMDANDSDDAPLVRLRERLGE